MSAKPNVNRAMAQPKSMSSRLLTMKFMQRAASGVTPAKSKSAARAAALTASAYKAAVAQEAAQRDAAAQRMRAAKGEVEVDAETRWELSFKTPLVQQRKAGGGVVSGFGFGELHQELSDSGENTNDEEEEEEEEEDAGRLVFGGFRKKGTEKADEKPRVDGDDYSDSVSDSEEDDKRTLNKKPKDEEVSLRGLHSISSGSRPFRGAGARTPRSNTMQCHGCNESGHVVDRCPKRQCFKCGELGHSKWDCNSSAKKRSRVDSVAPEPRGRIGGGGASFRPPSKKIKQLNLN